MTFLAIAAATVLIYSQGVLSQYGPAANEVTSFPGLAGPLPSKQYAGYVNVPGTAKQLYYILVTAESDPATAPLVLWLNGGPGCASIGGGYIEEHGPFTYQPSPASGSLLYDNVTLSPNPYSWSKVANMLYIDSPAGTGLSYSTNPTVDYITDDYQATSDAYEALLVWFGQYPYFADHTFYLTGESYAGIYVPLIASLILNGTQAGRTPAINLVGYAIGNPSTDSSVNYNEDGIFRGFYLISDQLYSQLNADNCPMTPNNFNESLEGGYNYDYDQSECASLGATVMADTSNVFPYDINKDCFWGQQTFNGYYFNQTKEILAAEGIDWQDELSAYQPLDDYCDYDDRIAHFYLNDMAVRDAIHVAPFANSTQTLLGWFEMCTSRLNFTHLVESTIPYHMANIEAVVPTEGTQKWTSEVGAELGVLQPWSPWYIAQPSSFGYQIGGYVTQYSGLSFLTIRSAGHQVATMKPDLALAFFSNWINGTLNATTAVPTEMPLTNLFPPPETPVAYYRV